MRAALLLGSDRTVRQWQFDALQHAVDSGLEVVAVMHCENNRPMSKKAKNAGYYALAATGRLKMPSVQNIDISPIVPPKVHTIRFDSEWEGSWQRIPSETLAELPAVDVVIRFGMNLLRDPHSVPARYGVISYHHRDPEAHRGRPAGFYELLDGEPVMGVIVQQLSNTLDGGRILAKAYSRVVPTSYRRTLEDAYNAGVPLLGKALRALSEGHSIPSKTLGTNHKLPSNKTVIRATASMGRARLNRLAYGAMWEKRWAIGRLTVGIDFERPTVIDLSKIQPAPIPKGYTFAADPCGEYLGRVYAELMNARTGKGEIGAFDGQEWHSVELPVKNGHLSYPQIVRYDDRVFLFPEMASVGPPTLFEMELDGLTVKDKWPLAGFKGSRLVDGTLFQHDDHWYLFGGKIPHGRARTELWVSKDLMGPWLPHPDSPICVDPRGGRMAGPIMDQGGVLYRLGQDNSVGYGQAITVNRIDVISPKHYKEMSRGRITLKGALGPHTILVSQNELWLDFYKEKWTALAGLRRALARLR